MKVLRIFPSNINPRFIAEAVEALTDGELIAYPTDTFYAIGCDALNNQAIERLCRLKGIDPRKEALSVVCADISQASEYARIDNRAFRILKDCLPGPFTFILSASTTLPKVFKGRKEVGIRIPDSEVARAIARELGHPVLSTTAISSDTDVAITDPDEVMTSYDRHVSLMLDAGETPGIGTTVVSLLNPDEPEIVREGAGIF
ncbi:MAG: threonylcarbamoyl-AMP synthase [Paramuribaculum sp.]|nr:threonylcarbamoyl-AMP synthase [Paramuribaculum sp.]